MQVNHTLTQLRIELEAAIARAEKAEQDRDRWHKAAMDAGVIVCDNGELAMPEDIVEYAVCERDAARAKLAKAREALERAGSQLGDGHRVIATDTIYKALVEIGADIKVD